MGLPSVSLEWEGHLQYAILYSTRHRYERQCPLLSPASCKHVSAFTLDLAGDVINSNVYKFLKIPGWGTLRVKRDCQGKAASRNFCLPICPAPPCDSNIPSRSSGWQPYLQAWNNTVITKQMQYLISETQTIQNCNKGIVNKQISTASLKDFNAFFSLYVKGPM